MPRALSRCCAQNNYANGNPQVAPRPGPFLVHRERAHAARRMANSCDTHGTQGHRRMEHHPTAAAALPLDREGPADARRGSAMPSALVLELRTTPLSVLEHVMRAFSPPGDSARDAPDICGGARRQRRHSRRSPHSHRHRGPMCPRQESSLRGRRAALDKASSRGAHRGLGAAGHAKNTARATLDRRQSRHTSAHTRR